MTDRSDETETETGTEAETGTGTADVSRRALLNRAGLVAGGAALAVASNAALPTAAAASSGPPGVSTGTTTAEFVAQIAQNGVHLIAYGYFTYIRGVNSADLFNGAPSETNAHYTAYADGDLVSRAVKGPVTLLDVVGTLDVYHRSTPGAAFSDPSSFVVGTNVGHFDLSLQDVLTVIAPNTGLPTLAGDMTQVGQSPVFSRPGARFRLSATGLGTRSDAVAPVAVLDIAGNIVAA